MRFNRFAGFPGPDGHPIGLSNYRLMKQFFELNKELGLSEAEFRQKAATSLGVDPAEWDTFYEFQDWDPDYNPDRRFVVRHRYLILTALLLLSVFMAFWRLDWISVAGFIAAGFISCCITLLIIKERI
jgi:hypothetical protein